MISETGHDKRVFTIKYIYIVGLDLSESANLNNLQRPPSGENVMTSFSANKNNLIISETVYDRRVAKINQ